MRGDSIIGEVVGGGCRVVIKTGFAAVLEYLLRLPAFGFDNLIGRGVSPTK